MQNLSNQGVAEISAFNQLHLRSGYKTVNVTVILQAVYYIQGARHRG